MSVATLAAVVHVFPDLEYLTDTVWVQMRTLPYEGNDLLELAEVPLLFRRQEREPFKERDHVLRDSVEVGDFVVPHTVRSAPERSASQMSLEESEDHTILLRNVEAQRDLPRHRVILSRSKRDVEATFSVCKAREVVTDLGWYLLYPHV